MLLGSLGGASVLVSFGRGFLGGLHKDEHALFGFVMGKYKRTFFLVAGFSSSGSFSSTFSTLADAGTSPSLTDIRKCQTHIYCHY